MKKAVGNKKVFSALLSGLSNTFDRKSRFFFISFILICLYNTRFFFFKRKIFIKNEPQKP